jgi:TP901 family phage tail tape measure protein
MAMNLEAVLRIAAKVVGLDEVTALERGLAGAEKTAGEAQKAFKAVVSSASWQAAAAGAVAFSAAIGVSVKRAIDFESAMSDVRKVVDGLDTPQGMKDIRQEIFALSREIPITAKGFAEMYAAAAQAGIPRQELQAFAKDVSKVAVAFDMSAGEAGEALAKIRTNLGLTQPELMDLADAANYLSNNMASTGREIIEFIKRSGTLGKQAGLSAEQTAAFGSAMIAAGAEAEVASTSFNNMIRALSRGDGMTDRQVKALIKLGYATAGAADAEKRLTDAVVAESAKRVSAIEEESGRVLKEIERRYRKMSQMQDDAFDDEQRKWSRAQEDKYEVLNKSLQRQRQAEINASNERAKARGQDNTAELHQIEDKYDAISKRLSRQQEDERIIQQRGARDRQQDARDQMEQQKQIEIKAAEAKFKEMKRIEELRKQDAIKNAKETAQAMVKELGPNMAKALQKDAVGTIRDVFARIKGLPKEMQISVISDLFGDEARALQPLINNTELLEKALGLVGEKSQYAGSTAAEFVAKIETTASKLKTTQNLFDEFAITIGETILPAIKDLLEFLAPAVEKMVDFAKANPGMTQALVVVGGIVSGIVIAAPGILAALTIAGKIATAVTGMKVGATIAGWLGVVGPTVTAIIAALGGIITWVTGTLVPFLVSVFSGPVGWTVLAVAAVVAMAIAFREPIMEFFGWLASAIGNGLQALWKWGEPIRAFWADLWNQVVDFARGSLEAIGGVISWAAQAWYAILWQLFVQPWINLWNVVLREPIMGAIDWISKGLVMLGNAMTEALAGLIKIAYQVYVKPWVDLWQNVFREPVLNAVNWLQTAWTNVSKGFNQYVTEPIQKGWKALLEFLPNAMRTAVTFVQNAWTSMISTIRNALRGFIVSIANSINSVGSAINKLIGAFNNLPGPEIPFVPSITVPAFARGGVVDEPTLAVVGEGGEREYIVPESQMATAARNYQAGARGNAVLNGSRQFIQNRNNLLATAANTITPSRFNSSSRGAQALNERRSVVEDRRNQPVTINVKTGPVMEFQGERYVKLEELDRAMRITAEGVIGRLRTPAARRALGVT